MSVDPAWLEATFKGVRPKVVGALLRYFRSLDTAEEAFQDACLRALAKWPENGPPRDPAAWLILVGRNSGVDGVRRRARMTALPDEAVLSDTDDAESLIAERLDGEAYRDDILRLLFTCCHPSLPDTQGIALALRVVSGLSVAQVARAFLVSEAAMEQRITRAKRRVGEAGLPFETPSPAERAERLGAVAAMLYLVFNEGYGASGAQAGLRAALCGEAIRLARLLLRLFPAEPEIMGLLALMLLSHARSPARLDAEGEIVLLDRQDRALWDRDAIGEGLALLDKAIRHRRAGPYQVQAAIAATHARARSAADTDWAGIERLYATLEKLSPSPVVTLNRAAALSKSAGAEAALALVEPLGECLGGYFYFHGLKGALLKDLGQAADARESLNRAIALATSAAEAAFIRRELDALESSVREKATA
jgi:RNA polymerase sigma-70 factor, ECF subfamily